MVVVLSRFRVANGMEADVARAFRERPRAVEQVPGFLWLEVLVDRADPSVFYLQTRWTDLPSFERWHASPAHRDSHALIPRGLKLDATWTQVYRLDRLDGTTGAPLTDTIVDAALLMGAYAESASNLYLLVLDRDGTIRSCNPAASRRLDPSQPLEGTSVLQYMPERDAARLQALLEEGPSTDTPERFNFAAPRGTPFTLQCWLRAHGSTVVLLGEPTSREDQQLQDELIAINEELAVLSRERSREIRDERHGRELAEKLNRERNAFLNVLAHELRQPIGSALAVMGVLRKMNPDPALDRPRALLERQLTHITRLVEDLTDTARVAAGDVKLQRSSVDLARQLGELATAWEANAQAQHKTFVCRIAAHPLPVMGDVVRLQQVFSNLMDNALKYTPPGGSVTLTTRSEGRLAVVDIEDEGEGIPPERLPGIFDLFQRATNTGAGLGVGLAVVHALVTAHGGTIVASSPGLGRGATFTVRLPLVHADT